MSSGPLETTAADFWRMIWDQKTLAIVMMTKLVEEKLEKSYAYWKLNEGEVVTHGNISIKAISVVTGKDFTMSSLEISHLKVIYFNF